MNKRLVAVALASGLALTGCNVSASLRAAQLIKSEGWTQPTTPDRYGTWTHDPAINNGCNETDVEGPEVDNQGKLCQSYLP